MTDEAFSGRVYWIKESRRRAIALEAAQSRRAPAAEIAQLVARLEEADRERGR